MIQTFECQTEGLVFRFHLKSEPFDNQTNVHDLNIEHVRYSDPKSAPKLYNSYLKFNLLSSEFNGLDLEVDSDCRNESCVERVVRESELTKM